MSVFRPTKKKGISKIKTVEITQGGGFKNLLTDADNFFEFKNGKIYCNGKIILVSSYIYSDKINLKVTVKTNASSTSSAWTYPLFSSDASHVKYNGENLTDLFIFYINKAKETAMGNPSATRCDILSLDIELPSNTYSNTATFGVLWEG